MDRTRFVPIYLLIAFTFFPASADAWSASGHHMVAVVAYDLMNDASRTQVMEVLRHHPQFDQEFKPPAGLTDRGSIERWQLGIAACWPDFVRDTSYDRPQWHYELGASLVLGKVRTPPATGPLPTGSDLRTKDIHLSQAVNLCVNTFNEPSTSPSDRAIALCWILHLFADGHQPCHAGSLYAPAFPMGDRGGNTIRLSDGSNLHAAWDNLLGSYPSANEVRRRVNRLGDVRREMTVQYNQSGGPEWLRPETWLDESKEAAKTYVYTDEIIGPVTAASRGMTENVPPIKLSSQYYKNAGELARYRVKQAGYRVGVVLVRCLQSLGTSESVSTSRDQP